MAGDTLRTRGYAEDGTAHRSAKKKVRHRNITKDPSVREEVALRTFWHNGQPSLRPAREVAREMSLSPQAVSAIQRACIEPDDASVAPIVHPLVMRPAERKEVPRLQDKVRALYALYGLREVYVVPGNPAMLDASELTSRRAIRSQAIQLMARKAAELCDRIIKEEKQKRTGAPFTMGVAWGRTMKTVAEYLLTTPRTVRLASLEVLPIIGITAKRNMERVEANIVAMDWAQAYGGLSEQLPCEAVVPRIEYSLAVQRQMVREMLSRIRQCRVVWASLGPILEEGDDTDIALSNDPETHKKVYASAQSRGAIGEICCWCFGPNGEHIETDHTAIGLGYKGLRDIVKDRDRNVVLCCAGDKRRLRPLKAALLGGLASVLVTDTVSARYLVGEIQL